MSASHHAEQLRPQPIAPDRDALLAELFDLDVAETNDDLPFYEGLARAGNGTVLELGVGTARVALALARAGCDVYGIDASPAMIARAERRGGPGVARRLHLTRADMRDFVIEQQFDLVFAAFGTFHHLLTRDDQLACLRAVSRHLRPGGVFAFDLRPVWFADWEEGESVPLLHDWTRPLLRTGETVMKFRAVRPDIERELQHETHIYDCLSPDGALRRITNDVDLRYTTPAELEELLSAANLRLEHVYGDFDRAPFDEDSDLMITVARKEAP
jgi:SAM-dependent methyltransferase